LKLEEVADMSRNLKLLAALAAIAIATGCATVGGAAAGAGIAKATGGDATTGALIGGGIGMMATHL
jgi:hypothetical protein